MSSMCPQRVLLVAALAGALSWAAAAAAGPPGARGAPAAVRLLPEELATTWAPGLLPRGGVPERRTACATLQASAFGDGARDATAAIQAALDACPEGQVVRLSPGTFTIDDDILFVRRGVTLRGAGAEATELRRTNGAKPGSYVPGVARPVVVVGPSRWATGGRSHDLAADAVKGLRSVRLAAAPDGGLVAGQIVIVDELSGAGWRDDPAGRGRIWASADWRVVYQRHDPPQPGDDPFPDAAGWFCRQDRPTAEHKEVESWDPATRTVTFTSPFHIGYRTAHRAQLFAYAVPHVKGAGVEDLRLQGGDDGQLRFQWAAHSWAARVESTGFLGEGVAIHASFRVELRDSYVHTPVWMEPGGGSYNISLAHGSSEILVENNISVDANKLIVARSAGAGSVVAYNYLDDGRIGSSPGWVEIGLNASHMVGPHHVLLEGNYAFNADSDKTHGNAIQHTFFRNHLSGHRRSYPGGGPARCAGLGYYSYGHGFVGNVLGLPGRMEGWAYEASWTAGPSVWKLGWDDFAPHPSDPRVVATTHRHGNLDWVTRSVRWAEGFRRELPASLYLSGRPAFFDAGRGYTWPWVDPTAATPVATLPAKARYDAGTPFTQP